MALESATYLSQLNSSNPPNTDLVSQADDHIRLVKSVLQNQFPNFTAAALAATNALIDAICAGTALTPATFTGTLTGMTGATTGTVKYIIAAGMCTLFLDANLLGTSNTTTMTMTGLPAGVQPSSSRFGLCCQIEDNTVGGYPGVFGVAAGVVSFYPSVASLGALFTASGTKGLNVGWVITYPL